MRNPRCVNKPRKGLVGRDQLLEAESKAYHGPGTCTFYGTANSNQMLLEAMGLHVPGSAFIHPHDGLREALTREAVRTVLAITKNAQKCDQAPTFHAHRPFGGRAHHRQRHGGAAGHGRLHQPFDPLGGCGPRGGHLDRLDRFFRPLQITPLLSRVYPNGSADVNQFQAAGGPGFVLRELLQGWFHACRCGTVSA
jgi:phosphogluconate dehydratase